MAEEAEASSSNRHMTSSNPCPICLGPLIQESYLDQCFHNFCYNCIVRWTKVVGGKCSPPASSVKCPLCKTDNFSIVHGYNGNSFQLHHINQNSGNSSFFSEAHKYRLQCYYVEPVTIFDDLTLSRYWKMRKYLQENQWLQSWLRREIQALLQEEDVEIIVHHILGTIDSFKRNERNSPSTPEKVQEKFKCLLSEAAKPFLSGRTSRFVDETHIFLVSGLKIEAYDKVYLTNLGWKHPGNNQENEEVIENAPSVPSLFFFDEDSDELD